MTDPVDLQMMRIDLIKLEHQYEKGWAAMHKMPKATKQRADAAKSLAFLRSDIDELKKKIKTYPA